MLALVAIGLALPATRLRLADAVASVSWVVVARELARVGGGGSAFRYGGEEFAILFPGKSVPDVLPHLEAAREAIATSPFVLRGADRPVRRPEAPARGGGAARRPVHVTISIGVAAASRKTTDPRSVLDAADAALYRAKGTGRNRVVGGPEMAPHTPPGVRRGPAKP